MAGARGRPQAGHCVAHAYLADPSLGRLPSDVASHAQGAPQENTAAQVDGFAAQIATVAKRRHWETAPATPLVLETLGRANADLVALFRQAGALARDTANHRQTLQVQLQHYNARQLAARVGKPIE